MDESGQQSSKVTFPEHTSIAILCSVMHSAGILVFDCNEAIDSILMSLFVDVDKALFVMSRRILIPFDEFEHIIPVLIRFKVQTVNADACT